jgi:hypothetical protein
LFVAWCTPPVLLASRLGRPSCRSYIPRQGQARPQHTLSMVCSVAAFTRDSAPAASPSSKRTLGLVRRQREHLAHAGEALLGSWGLTIGPRFPAANQLGRWCCSEEISRTPRLTSSMLVGIVHGCD